MKSDAKIKDLSEINFRHDLIEDHGEVDLFSSTSRTSPRLIELLVSLIIRILINLFF